MTPLIPGDLVRLSPTFLDSIASFSGALATARGRVIHVVETVPKDAEAVGVSVDNSQLAYVAWEGRDDPPRQILAVNLEKIGPRHAAGR